MLISGNIYTIEYKKHFNDTNKLKPETVLKVFEFAYAMSFGQEGEHRNHRSGGRYNRKNGEIFINTFQGKLAELGVYNEFYKFNKEIYESPDLSKPDFDIYGLGVWDTADIEYQRIKFSIKSTKFYGNLLLLETKDWNSNAEYIPNIEEKSSCYDYIVLVRIKKDGEALMKSRGWLYANNINKAELSELITSEIWTYDIPGYITNDELKEIIKKKQIIPQNALLNGKIPMDAENYYEEAGKLKDFTKLILELPV